MARRLACGFSVLALLTLVGCGGGGSDTAAQGGGAPAGVPINNNDPRASTAPGAPSNPSIPYPGQMKKRGGR